MNARQIILTLAALDAQPGVLGIPELMAVSGGSRATVFRMLQRLQVEFRMQIAMSKQGGYTIRDWGVFSRTRVCRVAQTL